MIERRLVTAAVANLLAAVTGKPVGRAAAPLDPATGRPYAPPYLLLYPLEHTADGGGVTDNNGHVVSGYQVTCVSGPTPGVPDSRGTVEQAEWLADKARRIIDRPPGGAPGYVHPLTVPGAVCTYRQASEAGGTSEPADAIITYVIRFRFHLEAA